MKIFFKNLYPFIYQHAKLIELVCILGTLAIIAFQTSQMNLNLKEMRRNFSLDVSKMVHEHKQRINHLLIDDQNAELRKVFKLDKEKVLYFIMVNDYSNLYLMKKQGLMKNEVWIEVEEMMVGQISNIDSLYEFWNMNKKFFNQEFVTNLNPLINKSRPERYGISSKSD